MKILQQNLNSSASVMGETKRNVSVVRFKFRCNILISGKIIKEMPGSVASGTPCICHTELLTACEQDQDGTHPARKQSANLYDIYHCCVYSEKLLMMDRGTVRNM